MCDIDAEDGCVRETKRQARKEHTCTGCGETISPKHIYIETASLYDGCWSTCKHCARCNALFDAIVAKARETSFSYVVAIDPRFSCGESWVDNFGPPPPEVVALAFMVQGESLPDQPEEKADND